MDTGVFQQTSLDAEFVVDFEQHYRSCLEAYVQVVILAGGLGTRLSEETVSIPKPMVSIGEDPIIVHLMRFFASFGHTKFLVALGYKGYVIKEFFANYALHNSDLRINIFEKRIEVIENRGENWEVELIDTGQSTMTGGRILRLKDYLEEDFLLTYGDGLSDVDLDSLIRHHRESQRLATVTAVRPPARFGSLEVENGAVKKFGEKIAQDAGLINGGFFCFSKKILNYLVDDNSILEGIPLERLVQDNQLSGFIHNGFWQPMDTMRDKMTLESIWQSGNAPWKR